LRIGMKVFPFQNFVAFAKCIKVTFDLDEKCPLHATKITKNIVSKIKL